MPDSAALPPRPIAAGLLRRRVCLVPTWRGWLALVLVIGGIAAIAVRFMGSFLIIHDRVTSSILVVEGWISPSDVREALAEFRSGPYTGLYVTGGPIEPESPLASYGSYAGLTADVFQRLGADPATLHAIPAPAVARDRTYSTALALKTALRERGEPLTAINVMTSGMHSRRSRLLYEKAFGPGTRVGMIALDDRGFDRTRWWTTSAGFRAVTSEFIAYLYARFLFKPPAGE